MYKHREKASILYILGLCVNTHKLTLVTLKHIQDLDSHIAEILQRTLEGNESLMEPKEKVSTVPWATACMFQPMGGVGGWGGWFTGDDDR